MGRLYYSPSGVIRWLLGVELVFGVLVALGYRSLEIASVTRAGHPLTAQIIVALLAYAGLMTAARTVMLLFGEGIALAADERGIRVRGFWVECRLSWCEIEAISFERRYSKSGSWTVICVRYGRFRRCSVRVGQLIDRSREIDDWVARADARRRASTMVAALR